MDTNLSASQLGISFLQIPTVRTRLEEALPIIEEAIQGLISVNTKFSSDGASWNWNKAKNLEADAYSLSTHIKALKIVKELNEEERQQLIPQLCSVYKILDVLRTNAYLDVSSKNNVIMTFNQIQNQFFGIGNELCKLQSLVATAGILFGSAQPEEFLIDVSDEPKLIKRSEATKTHSKNTYPFLANILSYLKTEHIIKHLSVNDLMKLKAFSCWMMANYIKSQDQRLDLAEHIYGQLREINHVINANLAQRSQLEYAASSCEEAVASLISLKTHLSTNHYFTAFWYDARHVDELKKCKHYLKSLNSFICDSSNINIEGLTFLKKNHEAGLALYEVPSQNERKTLIVFSYNREGALAYYNYFQSRSSTLGIGGLGHQPVYEAAEQSWKPLKDLLNECQLSENTIEHVITVGFGVDAAVAQVLSYQLAKEYPQVQTRTYGIGMAPYLDDNAAATIKEKNNHYAINIALKDDTRLGVSKFSNYVAKEYSKMNIHGEYQAHNRDWFMSDLTGHDRKIYAEKAEPAIQQPIEMHAMYEELVKLATTADTITSESLYNYMKNFK